MRDEAANYPVDERGDASGAAATGSNSQSRGMSEDAEQALLRADERGDAAAATSIGLLLEGRGDLAGAEAAYRRSDQRGDADGTRNLGRLLEQQDDLAGAEVAYRRASERGDPKGAFNLGRLLEERGDLPAAAVAYRRAERRGESAGATSLGRLLEQQGNPVGAAAAYRRASEGGNAAAAVHLGRLLASNGDLVGAEAAYRRADTLGDADGALQLAKLLSERTEPAGAEPADDGAPSAGQGAVGEAAEASDPRLGRRDDSTSAEQAQRAAPAVRHTQKQLNRTRTHSFTSRVTSASSFLSRPPRDLVGMLGLLLVALLVGLLTGASPTLGVVVAAALVFALIVMWDLALGVCLFLLVTFLDVVSANHNLSVTKGAGAVLAGSWLAMMATRRGPARRVGSEAPWLTAALVAFIAWSALSAVWAWSPSAATRSTERFALDALLVPIVFWAVRERKHVVWLFGVFVVGVLFSVLWGITQAKVAGGVSAAQVGRLTGAAVDANVLATLLIVCTVLASALVLVLKGSPRARTLALFAAMAALAAFFATLSRGGVVALAFVILAGCVYAGKARRAFVALAIGVVLVGAVTLSSFGTAQRLTSTNTSGRSDLWTVGLRIAGANPIVGVGSGNYTVAEPHYVLSAPGLLTDANLIIDQASQYPAHNIYLQLLAEMGVIGLALFLSVIVLSLHAAMNAVKMFRASGDRSMEILGRALVLAIVGILVADFFVSDQYSKQLWLLLGICPALLALARRSPVTRAAVPPRETQTALLAVPDPIPHG